MYVTYASEKINTPKHILRETIRVAISSGFERVGIETDQGGDTWFVVFSAVCQDLVNEGAYTQEQINRLVFGQAKAGAGHGSKVHRNAKMLTSYERGRVIHVQGKYATILEKSLKRFPNKPLDLADALYWLHDDLLGTMPAFL